MLLYFMMRGLVHQATSDDFQQISCSSDASENHMSNCSIIYKQGCGQGGYSCWNEKGIKCFSKSIGHSY